MGSVDMEIVAHPILDALTIPRLARNIVAAPFPPAAVSLVELTPL